MRSGRYRVQDVFCNNCNEILGWFYEHAFDRSQRRKEQKTVLEVAKIRRVEEKKENGDIFSDTKCYMMTSTGVLEVV